MRYHVTMQAAQQTEVYWMALTRDVPFSQYGNDGLVQVAAGKSHSIGIHPGSSLALHFYRTEAIIVATKSTILPHSISIYIE